MVLMVSTMAVGQEAADLKCDGRGPRTDISMAICDDCGSGTLTGVR